MGNSANSLPFEATTPLEYEGSNWKCHVGKRTDDKKDEVTIFKYSKQRGEERVLEALQRGVQKLRAMRHPFVLTYLESADLEESLLLVTEPCLPLPLWLASHSDKSRVPGSRALAPVGDVAWGFLSVLEGLSFLHTTCALAHGLLTPNAIFVARSGDWKLAELQLLGNMSSSEDRQVFRNRFSLLSASEQFLAPERKQLIETDRQETDMFSLGMVFQHILDSLGLSDGGNSEQMGKTELEILSVLSRLTKKMVHADPRRRASAGAALSALKRELPFFGLMDKLQQLALSGLAESADALAVLTERAHELPASVCAHRLLPAAGALMTVASGEFKNRDSRELVRQSITMCLQLLSVMAERGKLEEISFVEHCQPPILIFWSFADRTVRTSLLKSLANLAPFFTEAAINKTIFDQLMSGFADTNAKLREDSLLALSYLVPRLDEKNLQDKLVRSVGQLQNDAEAAVRTNAVIFIGRCAGKLKEGIRSRVLVPAICRALKDPFLHCRCASASLQMIDANSLSGKLLPQVCVLTGDRFGEVREIALAVLEQSLSILRSYHQAALASQIQTQNQGQAPQGQRDKDSSSDSAWWGVMASAVDGLAKGMINSSSSPSLTAENNNNNNNLNPNSSQGVNGNRIEEAGTKKELQNNSKITYSSQPTQNNSFGNIEEKRKASSSNEGFDDNWDDDFGETKAAGGGWGDLDFDEEDFEKEKEKGFEKPLTKDASFSSLTPPPSSGAIFSSTPSKISSDSNAISSNAISKTASVGSKLKGKEKPKVTKLAVDSNESWDDF